MRYNSTVYADSKDAAAAYVTCLAEGWNKGLRPAAAAFAQVAGVYGEMMKVLGHNPAKGQADLGAPVGAEQVAALIPLVRRAKALDTTAVGQVKEFLAKQPE